MNIAKNHQTRRNMTVRSTSTTSNVVVCDEKTKVLRCPKQHREYQAQKNLKKATIEIKNHEVSTPIELEASRIDYPRVANKQRHTNIHFERKQELPITDKKDHPRNGHPNLDNK